MTVMSIIPAVPVFTEALKTMNVIQIPEQVFMYIMQMQIWLETV